MDRRSFVQSLMGFLGVFATWLGMGRIANPDEVAEHVPSSGCIDSDSPEYFFVTQHYVRKQHTSDCEYAIAVFDKYGDKNLRASGKIEPKIIVFFSVESNRQICAAARVKGKLLGSRLSDSGSIINTDVLRQFHRAVQKADAKTV